MNSKFNISLGKRETATPWREALLRRVSLRPGKIVLILPGHTVQTAELGSALAPESARRQGTTRRAESLSVQLTYNQGASPSLATGPSPWTQRALYERGRWEPVPGVPNQQGLDLPLPLRRARGWVGCQPAPAGDAPSGISGARAHCTVPARPLFSASRARSAVHTVRSGHPAVPGPKVPPSALALVSSPPPPRRPTDARLNQRSAPPLPCLELSAEPGGSGWGGPARGRLCAAAMTAPGPRPPPEG